MKYNYGVMVESFEPFNLTHMRQILHAAGQVDTLFIVITETSQHIVNGYKKLNKKITLQDKARWLQMACADMPFIKIFTTDVQPQSYLKESHLKQHDDLQQYLQTIEQVIIEKEETYTQYMSTQLDQKKPVAMFVSPEHPLASFDVAEVTGWHIDVIPIKEQYSSIQILQNLSEYWLHIHPQARGEYTQTLAIVGGESSGKTTLVQKLVNYYGADCVLEMGRIYVETDLGGTEVGLQYSDYPPIAIDHAKALQQAKYQAKAPVTIVDTDFVTTQAFCEEYEGQTHPFVSACIEEFKLDHTIFLENNTPWVADGMRSLGSSKARDRFEQRLKDIFARHNIMTFNINHPDYHHRYLEAINYIDHNIYNL